MPEYSTNRKILILDIEALRKVAGYAHWIPLIRGLHKDHFTKNFPGWEWNQIIPVLIEKKIVVRTKVVGYRYLHLSQELYIASDIHCVILWISDGETEISTTRCSHEEVMKEFLPLHLPTNPLPPQLREEDRSGCALLPRL